MSEEARLYSGAVAESYPSIIEMSCVESSSCLLTDSKGSVFILALFLALLEGRALTTIAPLLCLV